MANDPVKVAREVWEAGFAIVAKGHNEVLAVHETGLKIEAPEPIPGWTLESARQWLVKALGLILAPVPGNGLFWYLIQPLETRRSADDQLAEILAGFRRSARPPDWWRENVVDPIQADAAAWRAWFDGLEEPHVPGLPPMTEREGEVFCLIRYEGPISGKEIARHFGVSESTVTRHYIPNLKARGVKNRKTEGYYLDPPT
ncbi:MAG: helix-turn-helix transcriptional regulator [Coriobacteriia bacterium]